MSKSKSSVWPGLFDAVKDLRHCMRDHFEDADDLDLGDVFDEVEFEGSRFHILLDDAGAAYNIGFIRGAAEAQLCTVLELFDRYEVT